MRIAIPDEQVLAVLAQVRPVLQAQQPASLVGAYVDIGSRYGRLRQVGVDHDAAAAICLAHVEAWGRGENPADPRIRHIGDEELLQLAAAVEAKAGQDDGGMVDAGVQLGTRVQAGLPIGRALHEVGAWLVQYYGGDNPFPAPAGPSAYRAPAGIVRVVGRGLVDDAGPFLGGTVSYFHGPRTFERDRARFDADVATMVAMRADAARIISDLGWPGDREQDGPHNVPRLIATIDALWAAGIRTQLTLLGSLFGARYRADGSSEWGVRPYRLDYQAARLRYAESVALALQGREDRILLVEVCNEPENPGVGPLSREHQAELQRLLKARLPRTLVTLGAPGGVLGATTWNDDDFGWYGRHGDLVLPHLDRGDRSLGYGHCHQGIEATQQGFAWGDNEPIGPGSSVREERDPVKLRLGRTFAWACNAAFGCYHPYAGIGLGRDSDYSLEREPGWAHVFDARDVLPADLATFQFHNWHWRSNPVETLDGCWADRPSTNRGTIRTLGLTHGGRRVVAVLKVAPGGARIRPRESMRLTLHLHDGERYAPVDTSDYAAGRTYELPAGAEDALLIGEAR